MKTLNGPNDNVAGVALVRVEAATVRCKEAIVRCISRGGNDDELTKALNKIIANCCNGIDNIPLREHTRKALVTAARRYYYELSETKRRLEPKLAMLTPEMRNKLDDGSNTGIPVIDDYNRKIKIALKALSAEPPMVVKYKDGRVGRYSLRNASEMAARYDANIKDLNNLKSAGVKLVWTTSHPNCSPRCAPWQGRLYSLDRTSGVIDGNRYVPIERAIEANDGNSIINGYNCRHRLIEYFKGSRAPKEHSEAEMKKEYAKDVYQRRMENNIRQMKVNERLLRGWGLDKDASELRKKWRIAQNEYKVESLKMGRPYYPYRYVIDEAEVDYKKWYEAEGLTNQKYNATISVENYIDDYQKSIDKGKLSPLVPIKQYVEVKEEIRDKIVGQIVKGLNNTQITIKTQSAHFIERVFGSIEERRNGVSVDDALDCLKHGNITKAKENSYTYKNHSCMVTINPRTGNLIQVNPSKEK